VIINQSVVEDLFVNLNTAFNKSLAETSTQFGRTAMTVQSNGKSTTYDFIDDFPKMREWVGDKHIKNLAAHSFSIANKEYESTIEVKRVDVETDQLGIYLPRVQTAAVASAKLPDELLTALKDSAFTTGLGYDGVAFYSASHPVTNSAGVASTFSNVSNAALSAASLSAASSSYGAARLAIMTMADYDGRKLGLIPDLLEVPPALEATARILLESDKFSDQAPNPYRGTASIMVNPLLSSSTAWFLHCTNAPLKPFIYQERKAPKVVSLIGAETEFMTAKYLFGVEASCNVGFGLPQLSYGSTGV